MEGSKVKKGPTYVQKGTMPQWGKGVQGWMNGWVNINKEYNNYNLDGNDNSDGNLAQSHQIPHHTKAEYRRNVYNDPNQAYAPNGGVYSESHYGYQQQRHIQNFVPVIGDGRAILDQRLQRPSQPIHTYGMYSASNAASSVGGSTNYSKNGKTLSHASLTTADTTDVSGDVQNAGIHTPIPAASTNRRKTGLSNRRSLQRTNSHSDLLKKKARDRRVAERSFWQPDVVDKQGNNVSNKSESGISKSDTSGSVTVTHTNSKSKMGSGDTVENDFARLGVSNVPQQNSYMAPAVKRHPASETTGQYINEAAFASQQYQIQMRAKNQLQQQQQQPPPTSQSALESNKDVASDKKKRGKKGLEKKKSIRRKKNANLVSPIVPMNQGLDHSQVDLHQSAQFPDTNYNNKRHSFPPIIGPGGHIPHDVTTHKSMIIPFESTPEEEPHASPQAGVVEYCVQCDEMERLLLALNADVEYLRSTALQNEYICAECENLNPTQSSNASVTSGKNSVTSSKRKTKKSRRLLPNPDKVQESIALAEASQRLIDINSRHKRQIEQVTKETARWQNDMHMKLSKLSMMCKDLNDEAGKRKEESNKANSDLLGIKKERDSLASEVEILRARVEIYEKESEEASEIRRILTEGENEALDLADKEIEKRDSIIQDLTSRLQHTLDTLEIERQLQRQRRQIIFPSRSQTTYNRPNS